MQTDQQLADTMLGRVPSYLGYAGGPDGGHRPASLGSLAPEVASAIRIPNWGQSFGLTETTSPGGLKRARISGNLAASMPASATEDYVRAKRARYGTYEQQIGSRGTIESFESAIARAAGYAPFMDDVRVGMPRMNINDISTPGFYTNGSTPDNEIVLKKLPYYQTPGENDTVFVRRRLPNEEETFEAKAYQMGYAVTAERVGYTLPGINRYLAQVQKDVHTLRDHRHFAPEVRATDGTFTLDDVEGNWETAADILRFFYLAGVVNSEVFTSGESSVDRTSTGVDPALHQTGAKKVNVVMQGRAFVHNLWGAGLRPSTILWFILKRVGRRPEQSQYVVDTLMYAPASEAVRMELQALPSGRDDDHRKPSTSKNPWQFLPWASTTNAEPTDADLAYYDDFGHIRYGVAIPFAMVNKIDIGATNRDQERVPFDLRAVRSRAILDVILLG